METPTPKELSTGQKVSAMAIAMLSNIQNQTLDPDTLSEDQRIICTRHLLHEGKYTHYEIANVLGVCERTIARYKKKIRRGTEMAALVIDEAEFAQDLIEDAHLCSAKLRKAGKYKDAFEVVTKLLDALQSMGIVKKVAEKLNLKGQLSLLEVLEVDRRSRESQDTGDESGSGDSGINLKSGGRLEQVQE